MAPYVFLVEGRILLKKLFLRYNKVTLKTFNEIRNQFFDFYNEVKAGHMNTTSQYHRGHGLDHDITVSMLAVHIAPTVHIGEKAWCAGMLHSVDRVVEADKVKETMYAYTRHLQPFFSQHEIDEIVEAAFHHSELNQADQNETQTVLMDADRLANMQSAVIIRGGQFRNTLPVFEFSYLEGKINPSSTYENPQSILDNLRLIISQYIPQLRLPKAQTLGSLYATRLTTYIQSIEQDYKELNLVNIEL